MALHTITFDADGIILRVKVLNSSVATGAGLTGLTSASSSMIISTIADIEATATTYTVAASNVETITTLGTYQTPTSGKCRFKEVDATNHKGLYEIHLANARFSVTNAKALLVSLSGATNMAETDFVIDLTRLNLQLATVESATPPPTAATTATAVRSELATELARLDENVSTRMATFTVLPPDSVNADALASDALNLIQAGLATSTALAGVQTDVDTIQAQTTATALRTAVGLDAANTDDQFDEVLDAIGDIPGGGGGGSTTVTPLAAGDIQRVTGTTIEAYVDEVAPITVYAVTDANGDPVDLDPLALTVHIEDQHHAVVESIPDPTIGGVDDNDFTFTPDAATVAQARQLLWSLRINSTGYVLAHGVLDIKYAARGE